MLRTKAAKYLLVGLLMAVALMPVALFVAAMMLAGDYDGYCSSMGFGGPPGRAHGASTSPSSC